MKYPLSNNPNEIPRIFQFNNWQVLTDIIKHNNAIAELQAIVTAQQEQINTLLKKQNKPPQKLPSETI